MISIRDLEFPRVQIDLAILLAVILVANFELLVIIHTLSQWLVLHHLHTTKIGFHDS